MGPLKGVRVLEMAGIGPAPYCCMLLGDMGADVLRVDRLAAAADLGIPVEAQYDLLNRNKRSIALDLKSADGIATVLKLVARADVLVEGFRPGVMERLGLGPEACFAANEKLIYGRLTGFGQDGPLAPRAGHDVNYIALSGALAAFGRQGEKPVFPVNTVGDFAGGSLFLAMGVLAALLEARGSGRGQVVDAAMVDGSASLITMLHGFVAAGIWSRERGTNLTDGGAPFYDVYATKDGKYVAIGALEARFYAELLQRLGLADADLPPQHDRAGWPALRARFTAAFLERTRDEWCAVFDGSDACFTPVLDLAESTTHPHNVARGTFHSFNGVTMPGPAPRFSRTPGAFRLPPPEPGGDTATALAAWGVG